MQLLLAFIHQTTACVNFKQDRSLVIHKYAIFSFCIAFAETVRAINFRKLIFKYLKMVKMCLDEDDQKEYSKARRQCVETICLCCCFLFQMLLLPYETVAYCHPLLLLLLLPLLQMLEFMQNSRAFALKMPKTKCVFNWKITEKIYIKSCRCSCCS